MFRSLSELLAPYECPSIIVIVFVVITFNCYCYYYCFRPQGTFTKQHWFWHATGCGEQMARFHRWKSSVLYLALLLPSVPPVSTGLVSTKERSDSLQSDKGRLVIFVIFFFFFFFFFNTTWHWIKLSKIIVQIIFFIENKDLSLTLICY